MCFRGAAHREPPIVRPCAYKDEPATGSVTSRLFGAKELDAQRLQHRLVDVDVDFGDARVVDLQIDHADEFSLSEREDRRAAIPWLRHQDDAGPCPETDQVSRYPVGPVYDKSGPGVDFPRRIRVQHREELA